MVIIDAVLNGHLGIKKNIGDLENWPSTIVCLTMNVYRRKISVRILNDEYLPIQLF